MILTTALATVATASLAPQSQDYGFLMGAAEVVFTDQDTADEHHNYVVAARYKAAGIRDQLPGNFPPPPPGGPDLSSSPPWSEFPTSGSTVTVVADGFSSGLPYMPINGAGLLSADPNSDTSWVAITFTVLRDTQGEEGSFIAAHNDDNLLAATLQFTTAESTGVEGVGEVLYANNGPDTCYPEDSYPENSNVTAIDNLLPMIWENSARGAAMRGRFEQFPYVVFSLDEDSAVAVNQALVPNGSYTGADVFVTEWLGAAWSTPVLLVSGQQLEVAVGKEVTGLSYDASQDLLVYASDGTDSQVMVAYLGPNPGDTPSDVRELEVFASPTSTQKIAASAALGLQPTQGVDKIGGLCVIDPRTDAAVHRFMPLNFGTTTGLVRGSALREGNGTALDTWVVSGVSDVNATWTIFRSYAFGVMPLNSPAPISGSYTVVSSTSVLANEPVSISFPVFTSMMPGIVDFSSIFFPEGAGGGGATSWHRLTF